MTWGWGCGRIPESLGREQIPFSYVPFASYHLKEGGREGGQEGGCITHRNGNAQRSTACIYADASAAQKGNRAVSPRMCSHDYLNAEGRPRPHSHGQTNIDSGTRGNNNGGVVIYRPIFDREIINSTMSVTSRTMEDAPSIVGARYSRTFRVCLQSCIFALRHVTSLLGSKCAALQSTPCTPRSSRMINWLAFRPHITCYDKLFICHI